MHPANRSSSGSTAACATTATGNVKSPDGQAANEERLRSKLQTIKDAYNEVKTLTLSSGRGTQVDLLLCADLNRRHVLWGGAQVFIEVGRTDEAEPTIDSMQENAVASLLPSGTVTWEHYNGSTCSTMNLLLASSGLSEACEYCGVHTIDHGSDHKAIRAHFVVDTTDYEEKRRKRRYDKVDRKKIREEVWTRIADDSSLRALLYRGQVVGGCQQGFGRPRRKGATVALHQAMVDRRSEDATAFVERSTKSTDKNQTKEQGRCRSRRQCQTGSMYVHGQHRAMQKRALDGVLGQSR
jgi:hypothetical protein